MIRLARAASGPPLLVGIAGGSGSGKSSLAQALVEMLGPARATLLAHEAYRRDGGAPEGDDASAGLDGPEAFDQTLFLQHLAALRAGRPVRPPTYCTATRRRADDGVAVEPCPVVVVEGALLLWDAVVRAALDLTIYLDAPEHVRLERRLARDVATTGHPPDDGVARFAALLRDAHRTYVEPTRALADLVLSTAGRIQPIAEIAGAVILDRLARRRGERRQLAS
jgi:uridine kinase